MSRVCAVSGKKALSGNKRSHSLHASRRKWNVNLQKVKVMVDGKPQRIRLLNPDSSDRRSVPLLSFNGIGSIF